MGLLGFETYEQLKQAHFKWVDSAIQAENKGREAKWTQSIAVGNESFIEKIKEALGFRARGRKIHHAGDSFELRETLKPYGTTNALASGNTFLWDQ
jgi:3-hydroxyisobutyrate dehydrogenase-like beta-hydroxyacid dehydrogenase